MTSIPTFRGPMFGDYRRARAHEYEKARSLEIARIHAHLGPEPAVGPDGLYDFGNGTRGRFVEGTPMRLVNSGPDAQGRHTRSFVRFDYPRALTAEAARTVDRTSAGEDGAAWARRVLGKVEPPTPQPGSPAARAVALGFGKATAVTVNSEGEDGATWARRVLGKKTSQA